MTWLKNIFSKLNNKKIIIIFSVIVAIALIIILVIFVENRAASLDEKALASSKIEQAKKLKSIIEENKRLSIEAAKQEQIANNRVQEFVNSGAITSSSSNYDCSRFENRDAIILYYFKPCMYSVRAIGKTNMAVVFVSDDINIDYSNDLNKLKGDKTSKESLQYINQFMARETVSNSGPENSLDISFFGPYQQVSDITVSADWGDMSGYQTVVDALEKTSIQNNVPESEFDMVHYIYLPKDKFRSFAIPGFNRAYTNGLSGWNVTPNIFIHESLHLYNASDKYNELGGCPLTGRGDPFSPEGSEQQYTDIMCDVYNDMDYFNINVITAREIGWVN